MKGVTAVVGGEKKASSSAPAEGPPRTPPTLRCSEGREWPSASVKHSLAAQLRRGEQQGEGPYCLIHSEEEGATRLKKALLPRREGHGRDGQSANMHMNPHIAEGSTGREIAYFWLARGEGMSTAWEGRGLRKNARCMSSSDNEGKRERVALMSAAGSSHQELPHERKKGQQSASRTTNSRKKEIGGGGGGGLHLLRKKGVGRYCCD